MKKCFFLLLCGWMFLPVSAQVTLTDCVEKARNNYPQIKEHDLIRQTEQYDLSKAMKNWLPQLTWRCLLKSPE